jgi:hypothetical protein
LIGVAAALVALLADAVLAVSRKPRWGSLRQELRVVETVDRRKQTLPFVGVDRRTAATEADIAATEITPLRKRA